MADSGRPRPQRTTATTANNNNHHHHASTFLRKLQAHAPNSGQLLGFMTLLISGSILLILSGITITVSILALIFCSPLIILSSPIWIPIAAALFFSVAGILSFGGFLAVIVGGSSWIYRYYRGMNPPGSERFDYARGRIFDTASHVKDYARDYGGYLQNKVKDAAPGA